MKANGKLYYSWLAKPDTRFGDGKYHVDLVVTQEEADRITKESGVKPSTGKNTYDGVLFKFSSNAQNKDGSLNNPPRLVDADRNEVDVLIGNGTVANVAYSAYEYSNYGGGVKGILHGVQILELIEYVHKDPFDVEEGGFTAPKVVVSNGDVEDAFDE